MESAKTFVEKTERIARIFEVYFSTEIAMPNKGDYLLNYPKTTAMIDNNQQFFLKSLGTLVMLDNDKLAEFSNKKDSKGVIQCNLERSIEGFVCGLHMPNQLGTDPQFVNFLMNEYLNYRFFVDFYVNQQQKRMQLLFLVDSKDNREL